MERKDVKMWREMGRCGEVWCEGRDGRSRERRCRKKGIKEERRKEME